MPTEHPTPSSPAGLVDLGDRDTAAPDGEITLPDGTEVAYYADHRETVTEPRIDVTIHGITVVLPAECDLDPETLLLDNNAWVAEKYKKFQRYREQAPDRQFEPGETFLYLGEELPLRLAAVDSHRISDDAFLLAQDTVQESSIRDELETLYRQEARAYLTERIEQYAEDLDVTYRKFELRNQRTRWASCSPKQTLSFNWRLIMAPPDVIDYIVVHELVHLEEPSHSRRFWSLVAEYVPDYEEHADWLAENSAKLIFTEEDL